MNNILKFKFLVYFWHEEIIILLLFKLRILFILYWKTRLWVWAFWHTTIHCKNQIYLKMNVLVVQLCLTLRPHRLLPTRLLCPWNFPGKNMKWVAISFSRGIFQTQGSNLGLPHCRQILYHLSHQGSPIYLVITYWN